MAEDPHQEEALGKAYDAHLMRRLVAYVRPYRGQMALAVALIVLSSVLDLVGPLATAVALDLFVKPAGGGTVSGLSRWVLGRLAAAGLHPDRATGLAWCGVVYLVSLLSTFGVLYWQSYVMQLMGQRIMRDLRREVFAKLQRLQVAFFDRNPVGRLVTRATTDVDALNELFTAGLVSVFGDVVTLLGIVCVLFALNWRLALVTFSILPLLLLITLWFKARARDMYRQVRVWIARINAYLQEHISGMAVVQLFGREEPALAEFRAINKTHRDVNVKTIFYYAVYYPAVELTTSLGLALIIWYGGGRVLAGALSIGALVAFFQYAQRFYEPISDLSDKYNILQAAMASSERIFKLLDSPVEIATPAAPYEPEALPALPSAAAATVPAGPRARAVRGEVELDHVSFEYKAGEPVLRDVSFRIEPGQSVAVVGHTGAGKSTLASLLLRFYDPQAGSVRVDGVDVRQWDLGTLRRSIAMVLQDVFLFAGNLADNVTLGDPAISGERLRWAAREARALDFIERLPQGFDTAVQERGAGLSVGQKQLVSFARALAFDPAILILDEATSSVDTETEQRIQEALDRLLVGRTSLVIAHRLSTVQRCDRILVMHKGELREFGTHQELLARRGIYYRLYLLQYRDQLGGEVGPAPDVALPGVTSPP
ncbi:MAG TPA: ABC transporter ATP-binding protein [Thermoanaerobaculia bacterium]|jgi:ATP-binding cassette subfamily B protein|nr:ABC transporter ATP-binding protein [Thermoanaerobaculia bacterium]